MLKKKTWPVSNADFTMWNDLGQSETKEAKIKPPRTKAILF